MSFFLLIQAKSSRRSPRKRRSSANQRSNANKNPKNSNANANTSQSKSSSISPAERPSPVKKRRISSSNANSSRSAEGSVQPTSSPKSSMSSRPKERPVKPTSSSKSEGHFDQPTSSRNCDDSAAKSASSSSINGKGSTPSGDMPRENVDCASASNSLHVASDPPPAETPNSAQSSSNDRTRRSAKSKARAPGSSSRGVEAAVSTKLKARMSTSRADDLSPLEEPLSRGESSRPKVLASGGPPASRVSKSSGPQASKKRAAPGAKSSSRAGDVNSANGPHAKSSNTRTDTQNETSNASRRAQTTAKRTSKLNRANSDISEPQPAPPSRSDGPKMNQSAKQMAQRQSSSGGSTGSARDSHTPESRVQSCAPKEIARQSTTTDDKVSNVSARTSPSASVSKRNVAKASSTSSRNRGPNRSSSHQSSTSTSQPDEEVRSKPTNRATENPSENISAGDPSSASSSVSRVPSAAILAQACDSPDDTRATNSSLKFGSTYSFEIPVRHRCTCTAYCPVENCRGCKRRMLYSQIS